MNGPIAQAVALVCHANAAIGGIPSPFWPANSSAQFCELVRFVNLERKLFGGYREVVVADTPDEWFVNLVKRQAVSVRLRHGTGATGDLPDRISSAFVGGGGEWSLEVYGTDGMVSRWIARWEIGDSNAPERRIWRVTYGLLGRLRRATGADDDSLGDARAKLSAALMEIHAFAEERRIDPFTGLFTRALESLGGGPATGYHKDLATDGLLCDEARTVLDACQSAWVFGGMGSWNDLGFEGDDQRRYERVSERLFAAVTSAIVAATNASASRRRAGEAS